MTRIEIHNKFHYVLTLLIAFTLPFGKLTPIFIGLLLINWIVEGGLLKKLRAIYENKFAKIFILFYLIHVAGLLYTENMNAGLFDLEVKLSLIIFPLVLASKPLNKKEVSYVFMALIIGLVYSSFYLLSRSVSLYFMNKENTFFYQNFSVLIHTSYISMYMNVAILWLLLRMNNKRPLVSRAITILLVLFFSMMIVLISSKSGIVTLILILFGLLSYMVFYKKKYLLGLIGALCVVVGLTIVYFSAPRIMSRVDNFIHALSSTSENETTETTSIRLLIWQSSNQVIKNNFLAGVGTGDVKIALREEYEKQNIEHALEQNFNTHNEFYQVFVAFGIAGFLLLCLTLFYPMFSAYQTKYYLYTLFLIIISINFLSESMLETQAGVMFYAFFNALLCFRKSESESDSRIVDQNN